MTFQRSLLLMQKSIFLRPVLLFIAALLVYWPALNGGVLWNDVDYITSPELQSLHGLWRIWFEVGATEQYYPLLHSAFWIEHRLWGDSMLGYHLINVFFHVGASCLLAVILRRLALPGAWLAAALFAFHPVCVESVAWVTEQKNTFSSLLYLAAGLAYLHFDRSRRPWHYWVATALFVLCILSKSLTATLPAALLVVFWWQRGRLEFRRDVVPLLPWFVAGAAVGLFTAWVEHNIIGASGAEFQLSVMERILVAGRTSWFYIGKTLWPTDLMFIYPRWHVSAGAVWQYLFPIGLLALIFGLWSQRHRWRGPLAAVLYFVGTLFPVMGFFNVYAFRFSFVADHWQYLPMLGLLVPVAVALAHLSDWLEARARPGGQLALGALVLVLGVMSWNEAWRYRDIEKFYRDIIARNPTSFMAHNNLAQLLSKTGRATEAVAHLEQTLRYSPTPALVHENMGNLLLNIPGRLDDARAHFLAAIRLDPGIVGAHVHYGATLVDLPGRQAEAIEQFQVALRIRPNDEEALNCLASELAKIPGRQAEALALTEQNLKNHPNSARAHYNLGFFLLDVPGRLADSIAHTEAAIRLNKGYAKAHNNLGIALRRIPGRRAEGLTHYEEAVRLMPSYADARFNLATALSTEPGRLNDAIDQFQALLQLQPNDAEAHNRLGEALLRAGRWLEARPHFEAALALRPDYRAARENLSKTKLVR